MQSQRFSKTWIIATSSVQLLEQAPLHPRIWQLSFAQAAGFQLESTRRFHCLRSFTIIYTLLCVPLLVPGVVPPEFNNMTSMTYLSLGMNPIGGTIPDLSKLTKVVHM